MKGDWCPYDQVRDCSHDDLHDEHREFFETIDKLRADLAHLRGELGKSMALDELRLSAIAEMEKEQAEDRAAIREHREAMFKYRSLAYQYAPLPIGLDIEYGALLDGDAPAIARAQEKGEGK